MKTADLDDAAPKPRRIKVGSREFTLPQSRILRLVIAYLLIFFGFLGFLPILGFWMIPLGVWLLSHEYGWVRRLRRRFAVWWERRKQRANNITK